ncbi:MAG: DUF3102 domain-containing protein [Candidatus Pacebacteria bacterium]|nr:DUF3102 domain-containing protein [Candidatus Paceibacterota bacterium]
MSDSLNNTETSTAVAVIAAEVIDPTQSRHLQVQEFANGLGYTGILSEDVLVARIREHQEVMGHSFLAIGSSLLILKEITEHGRFIETVESVGYSYRTAAAFMAATLRSKELEPSKVQSIAHLAATKVIELFKLEDEQIDDLIDGKSVLGKKLDDVERMTTRELRELVRSARSLSKGYEEQNKRLKKDLEASNKKILDAYKYATKDDKRRAQLGSLQGEVGAILLVCRQSETELLDFFDNPELDNDTVIAGQAIIHQAMESADKLQKLYQAMMEEFIANGPKPAKPAAAAQTNAEGE